MSANFKYSLNYNISFCSRRNWRTSKSQRWQCQSKHFKSAFNIKVYISVVFPIWELIGIKLLNSSRLYHMEAAYETLKIVFRNKSHDWTMFCTYCLPILNFKSLFSFVSKLNKISLTNDDMSQPYDDWIKLMKLIKLQLHNLYKLQIFKAIILHSFVLCNHTSKQAVEPNFLILNNTTFSTWSNLNFSFGRRDFEWVHPLIRPEPQQLVRNLD